MRRSPLKPEQLDNTLLFIPQGNGKKYFIVYQHIVNIAWKKV